jgi:hypothetical protein
MYLNGLLYSGSFVKETETIDLSFIETCTLCRICDYEELHLLGYNAL